MARSRHSIAARAAGCALAALLLLAPAAFAARAESKIEVLLEAVVGIKAEIPSDARTARFLGTQRAGSGVVIDSNGLVLTIGYLILEASSASVTGPDGEDVPADIVAYDYDTGFGLLRASRPLKVTPMTLGSSKGLAAKDAVLVASHGGRGAVHPAMVVSRRVYSGYWEYLLENAIFTAPYYDGFGGAALIDTEGNLVGIGSLAVPDAAGPDQAAPGNMFVPIDRLKPILADLLDQGRSSAPVKPWLGVFTREAHGRLLVTSVANGGPAAAAGIKPGDLILAVKGQPVAGQIDFYRKLWVLGAPGTEVPLTVLQGAELHQIKVRSADRYDFLKIRRSY